MAGAPLRASDRDREQVIEHLRKHCGEGRITLEELEERLDGVMAAATVADLSGFISDLPPLAARAKRPRSTTGTPPTAGPPGVRPFTHRVVVPASREETHSQVLSTIAPQLSAFGYELVTQSPTGLVFEYRSRPPWSILVAVVAFPLGLAALAVKGTERIVISLEPRRAGDTAMIVHGAAPRRVRKAFMSLEF
jgi:hypothetical protein